MTIGIDYHPSAEAQISHELRIPLTGIMGMIRFLNETPLNSQQQQYLQTLLIAAKQLLGLENQLYAALKTHKKVSFPAKIMVKITHSLEETPLNPEQKEYTHLMLLSAYRLCGLKHKIHAFAKSHDTLLA